MVNIANVMLWLRHSQLPFEQFFFFYSGLDGNRITRLSKKNLKPLASSNLYHL